MMDASRRALTIGCCLLSGCAATSGSGSGAAAPTAEPPVVEDTSRLSAEDLRLLQAVRIHESNKGLVVVSKGPVAGLACKVAVGFFAPQWIWKPALSEIDGGTPQLAAMTQLKLRAVRRGGNAVIAPTCAHNEWFDWKNGCVESWVCEGQAALLD